jgi:uncharacterized protein (DUF983 family)
MDAPPLWKAIGRAIALRCPRCGSGGLFRRWLVMVPECPGCRLHFEREPGYWLVSMTFNLAITLGLFFVVLIGGMVVSWPDVPWMGLWIGTVLVTALTPIVVHPWSRTLWVAVERHVRALSDGRY